MRVLFLLPLLYISTTGAVRSCKNLDFLITSQGGVGSSSFTRILRSRDRKGCMQFNSPKNKDGYKHLSADHYTFGETMKVTSLSTGKCAKAKRVLVIIGDQNHTLYSVTRRFKAFHINTLRANMGKPRLPPSLTRNQIRTLPKEELGIEYYRRSWFQYRNNTRVHIVTTEDLYTHLNSTIDWLLKDCARIS